MELRCWFLTCLLLLLGDLTILAQDDPSMHETEDGGGADLDPATLDMAIGHSTPGHGYESKGILLGRPGDPRRKEGFAVGGGGGAQGGLQARGGGGGAAGRGAGAKGSKGSRGSNTKKDKELSLAEQSTQALKQFGVLVSSLHRKTFCRLKRSNNIRMTIS